tara:strand:+ start:1409 stop:1918 length:510 start_codon:yes stop_codon:yes gene_type:complete
MKKRTTKRNSILFFLPLIIFGFFIVSCQEDEKDMVKPKSLTDIIYASNDFTILQEIVAAGKMQDALRTENLTLFAPNDIAFKKSGISTASAITSQPIDSIISFVNYHVLSQRYEYKNIPTGNIKAVNGRTIKVMKADSVYFLNKAEVSLKNVKADNGILHVVDRVLTDK